MHSTYIIISDQQADPHAMSCRSTGREHQILRFRFASLTRSPLRWTASHIVIYTTEREMSLYTTCRAAPQTTARVTATRQRKFSKWIFSCCKYGVVQAFGLQVIIQYASLRYYYFTYFWRNWLRDGLSS